MPEGVPASQRGLARKTQDAVRALVQRRIPLEFERIPLPIEGASYRKVLNWIAVEAGIALGRTESWGLPTHIQMEPSSRCNLRCTYCPVGTEAGPTGHMSPETFRKVVDDVSDHALLLVMWGWGEPFVCPSIYEMIDYAHQRGIRLASSTNAHLFVKPQHADSVVRSGLDALILSLSGTTQEAYERFRNGKLDSALAGTREIVAAKRRLGSLSPHLQMSFIVTDYSEAQVPAIKKMAFELGVDGVSLKKMNTASVKPRVGPDEALPTESRYRRFSYTEGDDGRVRVKQNPCKALWQSPTVRWDGRLNPCAYDFDSDYVLGDLKQDSLSQIWRGPQYRKMRGQFRNDWEQIPICSRCTYAFAGGNYDEIVADAYFFDHDLTD
jgi:radical SAM protein with 4Fe4S-binding SPASM domain